MEEYGSAQQATDDNIMWNMRFARWITKATGTPSEFAIFIAFPRRQLLSEHTRMLCYTYIACLCMLYAFFWVITRRLEFICRRFRTLCSIFIGR